jgi:peptidoglycan/LPS O-acetylase OafA/YrhL
MINFAFIGGSFSGKPHPNSLNPGKSASLNNKKPTENQGSGKLQIIDLVRTFSILSVLALHLKPTLALPSPAFRWAWDHFQRNGAYGVSAFFVVSGFLITRLIDKGRDEILNPRLKEFYVRRAARIFPLLLFVVLMGIFFTYGLQDPSPKFNYCFLNPTAKLTPLFWVSLATFSYNWFQVLNPMNYPGIYWASLWSLSVEEQFYLFYPLILKRLKNRKNLVFLLCGVIGAAFFWRLAVHGLGIKGSAPSIRASFGAFDQIAFGALLYLAAQHFRPHLSQKGGTSFFLCGSGLFITFFTYLTTFTGDDIDLVYGPLLLSLGLFLFLLGGLHLPFFESKHLKLLALPGKYSYGNYLFHAFVLYYVHPFLLGKNILLAFAMFVVATTCVSGFSFHFFETPVNKAVRKYFGFETRR